MRTAWIIDDDDEMSEAIRLLISLLDYQGRIFPDAPSAVQAIHGEQHPDLIFLDVHMPNVTGMDLLEYIRRRADTRAVPVIILSSDAGGDTIDRCMELGANDYLTKPTTLEEIERALARIDQR